MLLYIVVNFWKPIIYNDYMSYVIKFFILFLLLTLELIILK